MGNSEIVDIMSNATYIKKGDLTPELIQKIIKDSHAERHQYSVEIHSLNGQAIDCADATILLKHSIGDIIDRKIHHNYAPGKNRIYNKGKVMVGILYSKKQ